MTQLIKVKIGNAKILMEPENDPVSEKKVILTGGLSELGHEAALNSLMKSVSLVCSSVSQEIETINGKKPKRFSATFGFRINGEGNFYVVKTGSEASIQITAEWEN
jgi:hypothetical protein